MRLIEAPNRYEIKWAICGPKRRHRDRDRIRTYKQVRRNKKWRTVYARVIKTARLFKLHDHPCNAKYFVFLAEIGPLYTFMGWMHSFVEVTYDLRNKRLASASYHYGKVHYKLVLNRFDYRSYNTKPKFKRNQK